MDDTATTHDPQAATAVRSATPAAHANSTSEGRPSGTTFESLAVIGFIFGLFAIVVAVFAVGLAARAVTEANSAGGGGGGGGGDAPSTLEVSATEFAFDPSDAELASTGTITFTNAGTVAHDLVIEELTTDLVEPGATAELALDGLAPGDYQYYCSIPGHREAGMEGQILVG